MSILLSAFPVLDSTPDGTFEDVGTNYTDLGNLTGFYYLRFRFLDETSPGFPGGLQVQREIENPAFEIIQELCARDPANTWVRMQEIGGDNFNTDLSPLVWYRIDSNRTFGRSYTSSGGNDFVAGTIQFELASDSLGNDIIATSPEITWSVGEVF